MGYIALTRNPRNKKLLTIEDEEDRIVEYPTPEDAERAARALPLFEAWGFSVIGTDV